MSSIHIERILRQAAIMPEDVVSRACQPASRSGTPLWRWLREEGVNDDAPFIRLVNLIIA